MRLDRILQPGLGCIGQQVPHPEQAGTHQDLRPGAGPGIDHRGQGDLAFLVALVFDVIRPPGLGYPVPIIQHLHVIQNREIARVDDVEKAQGPTFEQDLQHLVLPPAPGVLHGIGFVPFRPHVRSRNDFTPGIDFIRPDGVAQPVSHDVEVKSSIGVSLLDDQGAHPADTVGAQLLVGHQGPGYRGLGDGEIDLPVKPVDPSSQTVPVVFQFQLGRLEEIRIPDSPQDHAGKRLNLSGQVDQIHLRRFVQGCIDPPTHIVGSSHRKGFLACKGGRLAGKGQGSGHVILPGALGRGHSFEVAGGVREDLLHGQAQTPGVGRQHVLDIIVRLPRGIVEGSHAEGRGPAVVARQIQGEHQIKIDALPCGYALAKIFAAPAVAVEEIVDPGQTFEMSRSSQKQHRVVGMVALENLRELQQGDDTGGALRPGGESGHHGNGVVVCLYNDDLVFPVLRSLAALGRQRRFPPRQPPVDIAGFHRLPVHPGVQVHLDRPPAGAGQQILGILPLDPEARNIDGNLQEFVRGLLPADESIVEKDDCPGAQGNRIQEILAAVEVEQDDAAFHRLPIQFLQFSLAAVDQGAAHPAPR